jgi:hypothetical protein
MLIFKGDNSVRRMLRADGKSLSSRDSRNFCSRIKNSASSTEVFSWRGIFDKCDSALPHAPDSTAFRNSETSLDSVLNPDSFDSIFEAWLCHISRGAEGIFTYNQDHSELGS